MMLLRIIPLTAVVLTLLALLSTAAWRPYQNDGLYAPTHGVSGLY